MSTIADNPIEPTTRRNGCGRATVRVTEELDSLVQQLRRQLWLRGICLSIGTAMVILLVLIVVDAIVQPQSATARFFLWLAGFLLCAETIRRSLWRPLRENCSRLNLAWSLEQRHPQIEERLTSTLQLAAKHEAKSSAFVEAIATQAQSGMASCSEESLAGRSLRNAIIVATMCVAALLLGLLLAPERLIPSLANVLRPWHDRILPRLTAPVLPGNAEIAEGADLEIQVTGLADSRAVLELLTDAATSERERVRESHSMVTDPENRGATFLLQDVEESLTYRVRSGGLYSDIFRITVHPAPAIIGLQATMTFPDYTQLPPATVDLLTPRTPSDNGAIVPMMMAIPGARVTLTGTANLPISEAAMLRDSNSLAGKAAANASHYTWEFEVSSLPADAQSLVQHCSVTMTSDHRVSSEPAPFEIQVARDLPPTVEIEGLNADTLTVRPDQSLEIPFSAVDDFGIQTLELAVRKGAQEPSLTVIPTDQSAEPVADAAAQKRNGSTTLDIAALNVKPGEALSVWLKVGDNRTEPLGGLQSSDSKIITLHIAEDAVPVGQQAVQQQHENAQKELRTAIDHLKTAQLKVERLSQSLPTPNVEQSPQSPLKPIEAPASQSLPKPNDATRENSAPESPAPGNEEHTPETSEPSETPPATPDSDAPTDPQSADKAASEAREQIQSAQEALQRMQDRVSEQPSPLFQSEMKLAQEVSEQELKKAEQQSSLIPLSDDLQQKQEAADAAAKELEQAIQKLEQIQSDLSQRSKDMELAAQLDELAKQQEKLAQRMKEDKPEKQNQPQPQKETPAKPDQRPQDQPAAGKDPSKDAQQQQKDIADALQKLAASDEDARSELFQKRAEEASRLAEETQRLQEQQEQLNQLKDSQVQPEQKREEQLMEMIAKEQDSIARQTRELDQAQRDRQIAKELEASEQPKPDASDGPQQPNKSLEEAGRQMDEASRQLRQKNVPQAEEKAQQAADTLRKSPPEVASDNATGQKPNAPMPDNESNADERTESLTKQQERVRDAIQSVRENRPEDAASKLQEQIAERTEQVRKKADELLQRPTDADENREAMKAAQEKLQQAAEQTKAANESQQPKNQESDNQQPQNQQPQNQQPQNQQRSKAAKALAEATQALQNVCKSCQNCSQCNKPGSSAGSSGKSGNSSKQANASEGNEGAPRDDGPPKESGPPKEGGRPKQIGGPPQDNGDRKQLAKAAEKATQTAKNPTPEGAKELSRDLNQLADQSAKKSQFPGRKPKDANTKQADKDGKPGNGDSTKPGEQSSPKDASNGKTGGKSNQPDGAIGNAQSSDQLDSPEQLRGPSTSNWTRSRRMLKGSVLDDRNAKVPQEYRSVVEDYFEQLSRIESADKNAVVPAVEGGAAKEQENQR